MARATIKLQRERASKIEVYCRDCDYHEDSDPKLAAYRSSAAQARKHARKIGLAHAYGTGHIIKVVKARYYWLRVEPLAAEAKDQLNAEREEWLEAPPADLASPKADPAGL